MKSFLWSFPPSAGSRGAIVSYWPKYVHKYWSATKRTQPAETKYDLTLLTGL